MLKSDEKLLKSYYFNDCPLCPIDLHNCKNKAFCLTPLLKSIAPPTTDSGKSKQKLINGLQNLGGTCYLNSFLQIYIRIPEMIKLIFTTDTNSDIVKSLRTIFARLLLSKRGNISPIEFADSLNLQTNIQQDAPEFHNLLCQCLTNKLNNTDLFNKIFNGSMVYEITCLNCKSLTSTKQMFSDINVNLNRQNIEDCISETYSEEMLDGDNVYLCEKCNSKQISVRRTYFERLPNILSLQLNRFSYDLKQFRRIKNSKILQIPIDLNLDKHRKKNDSGKGSENGDMDFELFAILLHLGRSAESGHYMAVVLDVNPENGTKSWIIYDDDSVKSVAFHHLDLNRVDRLKGNSCFRRRDISAPLKHLKSNTAYMVFYRRKNESFIDDMRNIVESIPQEIQQSINQDNLAFEEETKLNLAKEIEENNSKKQVYDQLKLIQESIQFTPRSVKDNQTSYITDQDFSVIPSSWLYESVQEFLEGRPVSPISEDYLCHHGSAKIGLKSLMVVKRQELNKVIAQICSKDEKIREQIEKSALPCEECVGEKLLVKRLDEIDKDLKNWNRFFRTRKIDPVTYEEELYLVANTELAQWKQYAKTHLTESVFNSQIFCVHQRLKASKALFVSKPLWQMMTEEMSQRQNRFVEFSLLPEANKDRYKNECCLDCTIMTDNIANRVKKERESLNSLLTRCNDLILNYKNELMIRNGKRSRRESTSDYVFPENGDGGESNVATKRIIYLISGRFIDLWRESMKKEAPLQPQIPPWYSNLFCEHKKLIKTLNELIEGSDLEIILSDEYEFFRSEFKTHLDFSLQMVIDVNTHMVEIPEFNDSMEKCDICKYHEMDPAKKRVRSDKIQIPYEIRRGNLDQINFQEDEEKTASSIDEDNLRRSTRRKMNREEDFISISDQSTLKDLKLKITELYGFSPVDQRIVLQKNELFDENLKLVFLDINESNKIYVFVEENIQNTSNYETFFQGTRLLCDSG